ncbi:MAG: hypothetical protein QW632_02640 [Ignisphaera sp.]
MNGTVLEVTILMGLDDVSNQALDNLKKASEILYHRYKIKLILNPINLWLDPLKASINSLPIIFIGSKKIFSGYPPSINEIIREAVKLATSNHHTNFEALLPTAILREDFIDAALIE